MTDGPHHHLRPGFRLLGPTTRPTTLRTGETIAFAKEALEKVVSDAAGRFIPQVVEHLGYLPPIGRVAELDLVEFDGDFYLAVRDEPLGVGDTPDIVLPALGAEASGAELSVEVKLSIEPRNFDDGDLAEILSESPTDIGEIAAHSALPPIIWSFVISVGAAGVIGAKAFLSEFFKKLGADSADVLSVRLRSMGQRAKDNNREQLAEFHFSLENNMTVVAYCPFHPDAEESIRALRDSLNRIADVAAFANVANSGGVPEAIRHVAFLWDGGWHLAWCATEDATFVTPWLRKNAPDPARFLGYSSPLVRLLQPYLPELPGVLTETEGQGPSIGDGEGKGGSDSSTSTN